MLQRNDTGSPQILPTLSLSAEPGEIIDAPVLVAGFTEVDEDGNEVVQPEPEPADDYETLPKPALVELAESRDLDATGTKDVLVARLREADAAS